MMDFLASLSIADNDNNTVDKLTIDDIPPKTDTRSLFNYTELLDPETSFRYIIPFNNDSQKKYRMSNTTPYDDLEDIKYHKQIYVREKLNLEQAAVFDHVTANPNDIVLLQGGPGTGKTFTMLTVANHFLEKGKPPNAVIFKRDAVHDYRFSANGYTVAQFMMRILHLNYSNYDTRIDVVLEWRRFQKPVAHTGLVHGETETVFTGNNDDAAQVPYRRRYLRGQEPVATCVMFEKHLAYLLNGSDDRLSCNSSRDDLYNFPLYPAFIKTIYMSMGRTIPGRVSLILNESTYQCLYVAISRVTSSENINSVGIPNTLQQHFISVLLNFDVTDLKPLDIGQIREKMLCGNYVYYDVPPKTHDSTIFDYLKMVAEQSLSLETKSERVAAREQLKQLVVEYRIPTRVLKPDINQADDDQSAAYRTTLLFLLKMKNTITSLATLTPLESRVWIHEFLNEPQTLKYMRACKNSVFSEPSDFNRSFELLNYTCDLAVSNTYTRGETSMDFMKKTSTQKCKADLEADPYLLKERVVMTAAAEDEEPPLVAMTTPTPNDNTLQCVKGPVHGQICLSTLFVKLHVFIKQKRIRSNQ